jgi:hypothetical protein
MLIIILESKTSIREQPIGRFRKKHNAQVQVVTFLLLFTPWPESTSELYGLSVGRLSAKSVPTFEDKGVSRSQRGGSPTTVIPIFLDWSPYFSFM